jgi:5'(3')-deoxyribonucleotidase
MDSTKGPPRRFVLGLDLDGVCADFYGRMREVTAEWLGVEIETLTPDVTYGLPEWGVRPKTDNDPGEYDRIHRFAVTQRDLFSTVKPLPGAAQSIRRLGTEGVRVRIITHRLFIRWFHEMAVVQTVRWLDNYGVPYWDLCMMRDKQSVDADVYIDDSPANIANLRAASKSVIMFDNSTNRDVPDEPGGRALDWGQAEDLVREQYYAFLDLHECARPPVPGHRPSWMPFSE